MLAVAGVAWGGDGQDGLLEGGGMLLLEADLEGDLVCGQGSRGLGPSLGDGRDAVEHASRDCGGSCEEGQAEHRDRARAGRRAMMVVGGGVRGVGRDSRRAIGK